MRDGEVRVKNLSHWGNHLVDGPGPVHPGMVLNEPLPVVGEGAPPALIETGVVGGHHHRDGGVKRLLQLQEGGPVRLQQHIVRVQPHTVVHGGVGEGLISGSGEVIPPGEVED